MFSHIDEVCQSWDVIHSDQNTWLRGKEPFGCLLTCCELCSLSALFTCSQFREFSCWYKRSKQNWELGIFAFFLTLLQLRLFSFLFLGSQTENYLKHTFFFLKENKGLLYILCLFPNSVCHSSVFTHLYFLSLCGLILERKTNKNWTHQELLLVPDYLVPLLDHLWLKSQNVILATT